MNPTRWTLPQPPYALPPLNAMGLKPGRWVAFTSALRWWLGRPWRQDLVAAIAGDVALQRITLEHATCLRPIIRGYQDRRIPIWQRPRIATVDFLMASRCFSAHQKMEMAAHRLTRLADLDGGFELCLGLNDILPEEGIWALSLRDAQGERVFQLAFGFHPGRQLVVGSVQGGRASALLQPEQAAKTLTKLCHGLRPPALLVFALSELARQWGCRAVTFVDPRFQAKSRWHRPPRHIRFDYTAMFRDHGMQRTPSGNWRLPDVLPRKALTEVESRKRAMYRRRHAWMDALAATLRETSHTPAAPALSVANLVRL